MNGGAGCELVRYHVTKAARFIHGKPTRLVRDGTLPDAIRASHNDEAIRCGNLVFVKRQIASVSQPVG